MTAARVHLLQLTLDELNVLDDALAYYRLSTEADGPDDHTVPEIRGLGGKIERYRRTAERAEAS